MSSVRDAAGSAFGENVSGTGPAAALPEFVEYLIVGAGVCGLCQLQRLLELDADVLLVDANSDLGGTWYKNRYPGCRFDSESYTYQYSFSSEMLQEWDWSERFAAQPETLAYLNYFADKFDLRPHIRFDSGVTSLTWSEDELVWNVTLTDGRALRARFVLSAIGILSAPTYPRIPGMETFAGTAVHTFDWPEDLDVTGKRVAVIGTGASGVQVITAIASRVDQLYVLQRGANWGAPLGNGPISSDEMADLRSRYDEIFKWCSETPAGFIHRPDRVLSTDVTREERIAHWNELYRGSGAGMYMGNYRDTMMEPGPNAELSEFIAERIRERVHDPRVADILIPKDHGFGTKRVAGESGYYEVFNQDNVELVDLKATPVTEITPEGLRFGGDAGRPPIDVDVIVYATGFDAVTGPFDRIDIVGEDGLRLRDKWSAGPITCLGVQVEGFPNLFILAGPQSGSASANFPRGIEDVVNWMTEFATVINAEGIVRVEAHADAEAAWTAHVHDVNSRLLMSKTKSWFNGHNKNLDRDEAPRAMVYLGGGPKYRRRLAEESANGYPSFELERASVGAPR
ncbi:flavin-containing monooxygenase [Microbacterium rhizomatis]|uniref:flavin-containing monooxygenase n=1 Tax=Microbacterium rhizomatis TaxID=1631477 RepID=UPI001B87BADD|nr:NAD(P)/FAD-dependent oxidoreductase [Microbacterium rhizomatis]